MKDFDMQIVKMDATYKFRGKTQSHHGTIKYLLEHRNGWHASGSLRVIRESKKAVDALIQERIKELGERADTKRLAKAWAAAMGA